MLELILADRDELRAIQHDVGGLQHRIVEQADVDAVVGVLVGLVLELGHPLEIAEVRDRVEHPAQLGVLGHHRLQEQDRSVVDAARDDVDHRILDATRHVLRRVGLGDRVIVDDAEDAAVLVLQRHPVADGAEVVSQMELPRRLDA